MNKIIISGIAFVFILLSCQYQGIQQSARMIKKMETQTYNQKTRALQQQERELVDSLFQYYLQERKHTINTFIKKHEFRNFVLQESFYLSGNIARPEYKVSLYTQDTVYFFTYPGGRKHYIEKQNYIVTDSAQELWNTIIYYVQKKDSVFIYKDTSIKNYNLDQYPSYFTHYKNGKLDQLTLNDFLIFRKKRSTMVVDFKKIKGNYYNQKKVE